MENSNKTISYITRRDIKRTNAEFTKVIGNLTQDTCRNYDIIQKIYSYYAVPGRLDRILPYVESKHKTNKPFSLRDFESFNVHVAPWINASFYIEKTLPGSLGQVKTNELFIIYQKYKLQLKCYNKETFDPFKRGIGFEFFYTTKNVETGEEIKSSFYTAVCQLNYFYWADTTGIMDYIFVNYDRIMSVLRELETIKKSMHRDNFKDIITNKQRDAHCYMGNFVPLQQTYIPPSIIA
jgi:hypothetical protein